jgi:c-di-GMP-binding flagellar brake protein YcgR
MVFPGIRIYPLQSVQYFKEDDPVAAAIFLAVFGAFILIVAIGNIVRKRMKPIGGTRAARIPGIAPRRFSGLTLRRLANSYGLDKDQTKALEYVFRTDDVSDPERVLKNPSLMDKHFKRAYKQIERSAESDEDAQRQIAVLFSTRNAIEVSQNSGGGINSTEQIANNMAAVITTGRETYPVRVISSRGENVTVECPRNALGTPIHLPRGVKVTLSFFTKSSKGFSFESRVLGMADSSDGPALQLAHSNRVKPLTKRRFRRRQAALTCTFSLVRVEEVKEGRKKEQRMVVDKRRFNGSIMDISIGGCAIKTSTPVTAGSRLKIEFVYSMERPLAVLGQVLRTNRSGTVGTVVHIKFIKIPRRTLNCVNAMVFEYDEED